MDGTGLNSGEGFDSSEVANKCEQMNDLRLKEYFEFISKCCFFTEFVLDKVKILISSNFFHITKAVGPILKCLTMFDTINNEKRAELFRTVIQNDSIFSLGYPASPTRAATLRSS